MFATCSKGRLRKVLPGCVYHRRPKGRCALRLPSAQPLPARRSGIPPRSDRRLRHCNYKLAHSKPSRVGRSGYDRETCTAKAGAVPSLTLRATVARTSLREQEEGARGNFLPPFVRCADISPAGGIFPAAFLLGCKTLFFPRRKEKGFS